MKKRENNDRGPTNKILKIKYLCFCCNGGSESFLNFMVISDSSADRLTYLVIHIQTFAIDLMPRSIAHVKCIFMNKDYC